jgi:hypothetical protein
MTDADGVKHGEGHDITSSIPGLNTKDFNAIVADTMPVVPVYAKLWLGLAPAKGCITSAICHDVVALALNRLVNPPGVVMVELEDSSSARLMTRLFDDGVVTDGVVAGDAWGVVDDWAEALRLCRAFS